MPAPTRNQSRLNRHGFTLVEIMVVVIIIGVLVGLTIKVIPRVRRTVDGAATQAQMAAIGTAIQAYYGDFRAYPGPIPNNELGGAYYVTPPTYSVTSLGATVAGSPTTYTAVGFDESHVTGAENLVLGLLGGLEYDSANTAFAYNPNDLFPDGMHPAPKGPLVLNPVTPKRYDPYLQVKAGDLSPVGVSFTDEAGQVAADSVIPEFIDKFSQPLPIVYLRTKVGTKGVVSKAGLDENKTAVNYQYDLAPLLGYTTSNIGIIQGRSDTNNVKLDHHGLQDILPSGGMINDPLTQDYAMAGADALVYLKDPNAPTVQADGSTLTTNATGSPRQKDAFIMIDPGPDRIYGTADDIVYPGGTVLPQ